MNEEEHKSVTQQNSSDIRVMTNSINSLIDAIATTNDKLDDVIDVTTHQNILTEKFNNLEVNLIESFGRVDKRVGKLETMESSQGCRLATELSLEKKLFYEKMVVANKRIADLEVIAESLPDKFAFAERNGWKRLIMGVVFGLSVLAVAITYIYKDEAAQNDANKVAQKKLITIEANAVWYKAKLEEISVSVKDTHKHIDGDVPNGK